MAGFFCIEKNQKRDPAILDGISLKERGTVGLLPSPEVSLLIKTLFPNQAPGERKKGC